VSPTLYGLACPGCSFRPSDRHILCVVCADSHELFAGQTITLLCHICVVCCYSWATVLSSVLWGYTDFTSACHRALVACTCEVRHALLMVPVLVMYLVPGPLGVAQVAWCALCRLPFDRKVCMLF
jgi:uncharacterized membrane protein